MQHKRFVGITAAIIGIATGTILGNTIWNAMPIHAKTHVVAKQATWHGLPQISGSSLQTLLHSKLENAQGKVVTLANVHRPIYFLAGWCHFCAATDKLLIQSKLMSQFQLVNVALDGGEKGTPLTPQSIAKVSQAKKALVRDWKYYGIKWSTDTVNFAMPGSSIEQVVREFPLVLVPHGGKWYEQVGYHSSPSFWHSILD